MLNTEYYYKFTNMIKLPVTPTTYKYMEHEKNRSCRCRLHKVFFLQYDPIYHMYDIETFKVVVDLSKWEFQIGSLE